MTPLDPTFRETNGLTDDEALALLDRLVSYWRAYGKDMGSPRDVTVAELAGDLIDSMSSTERVRLVARVEGLKLLQPDCLTFGFARETPK